MFLRLGTDGLYQWRIQGRGPGGGGGSPLFFDQNEVRRTEKNYFLRPGPLYLRVWMTSPPPLPPPTPYLKVWMRHCILREKKKNFFALCGVLLSCFQSVFQRELELINSVDILSL